MIGKAMPDFLICRFSSGKKIYAFPEVLPKFRVVTMCSGNTHYGKSLGEKIVEMEIEKRRDQLAPGQVTSTSEDYQNSRIGLLRKHACAFLYDSEVENQVL